MHMHMSVSVYIKVYIQSVVLTQFNFHLFAIFDFCSEYKKEKVNLVPVQKVIECYFFFLLKNLVLFSPKMRSHYENCRRNEAL